MKKFGIVEGKEESEPVQFLLQSEEGNALDSISASRAGFVIVRCEYWRAKSSRADKEINRGEKIKVVGKEADLLIVEHLHNGKQ